MTGNQKPFYITTPIYYVNDVPHIGHAYTTLACDVMARFKRLDGYDVYFLTGTDEHGQKVAKSAKAKGVDPQSFTDEVSQHFRDLADFMQFSNDDFIRTTEGRHKTAVQALWKKIEDNGYIYLDTYAGWYSVRDEAYYAESELVDGKAPTGADVEWVEEESYFFKLSEFQDKLIEWYEANPECVFPKTRLNEVMSFVKGGKETVPGALKDLSISRTTFDWGVQVPGHDKHVVYVWLDALTNYMSALGFASDDEALYDKFWPADIHMVGKDILRFHAVYWPAFLMAAELPLPKKVVAHGWWTNEGQKISKSIGNIIDPITLVKEFGLDPVRYFLLREVPFGKDGNYTRSGMVTRINSELANTVGNLAQRSLSMIFKNCEGKLPEFDRTKAAKEDLALLNMVESTMEKVRAQIEKTAFDQVLECILSVAREANEYIDQQAPWTLKKEGNTARMGEVLYVLAETVRNIALLLQPFMPDSAAKLLDQLQIDEDKRNFDYYGAAHALACGTVIDKPQAVFPRFVEDA